MQKGNKFCFQVIGIQKIFKKGSALDEEALDFYRMFFSRVREIEGTGAIGCAFTGGRVVLKGKAVTVFKVEILV